MAKTITIDVDAYEALSRYTGPGRSFSEVIREHFPLRPTGRDLADALDRLAISEATLDAVDAAVEERRRDPARLVDL